jgi:hypothetical protein
MSRFSRACRAVTAVVLLGTLVGGLSSGTDGAGPQIHPAIDSGTWCC